MNTKTARHFVANMTAADAQKISSTRMASAQENSRALDDEENEKMKA